MPTGATIGKRGLSRLSAAFFLTAAVMLGASTAWARFVGGGGVGIAIAAAVAVVCAGVGVYSLTAGRKPEPRRVTYHPHAPRIESSPVEILPATPEEERNEQRY